MNQQELRDIWYRALEENRDENSINSSIEKNRKGYCKLRFVDKAGKPLAGKKVKINQRTHDFKYGANIFMLDEFKDDTDNKKYREMFKNYFNLATIPFYWDGLEPQKGKPRFEKNSEKIYRRPAPELCVEYCEENGIAAKLHCLVYDKFTPDWLPKKDMAAMENLYEERIRQIAERYSGRLMEFEVINETLQEYYWTTQSVISQKRDVIEWAFALARKCLPQETLVINEGNPHGWVKHGYRNPYFMQIEKCLMNGAEIDKVGMQYHIFTGVTAKDPEEYNRQAAGDAWQVKPNIASKTLDIFAGLGLPLELTEVTFPTIGESAEDEELQAQVLKGMYSVWFSHPAVNTVVYWNTVDGYAYQSTDGVCNENNCRGGLFHHDLTPKKSALMLKKLFGEIWHTDLELTTDKDGYVEFRGFYGDYFVSADDSRKEFGLHKNQNNYSVIEL